MKIDKDLKKQFTNIYEFSKHDTKKCIFLLQKGVLGKDVYSYECMNYWRKFNKKLLEKEDFYNSLNTEYAADGDFRHAKRVWKDFNINKKER